MDNGLSKKERICSVKAIENLIARGRYANLGVIRVCHCQREEASAAGLEATVLEASAEVGLNRMMVSVPKKLFKRAVKRNLLKRRIREAYRLQKGLLAGCTGIDMMFVYNSKEVADFATIYAAVGAALGKIAAKYASAGKNGDTDGSAGSKEANESAGSKEAGEA